LRKGVRKCELGGNAKPFGRGPSDVTNISDAETGAIVSPSIRWTGFGLAALGMALTLYDVFKPGPLPAAGLLILPLVVLALVLYAPASFEIRARSGRRVVNGVLILPFMGLLLTNLQHAQVNPWWPLGPAVFAAAAVLITAWKLKDLPGLASPWMMLGFVTFCAGLYGYGAVAIADIQFDTSPGAVIQVQVLGKHSYSGKSRTYYLDLPPWGARTQPGAVQVSWSTYQALNVGDNACVLMHPGTLTLPWYTIGVCGQPQAR